jgi:polyphosphate kinase 2 (PPK2 family)
MKTGKLAHTFRIEDGKRFRLKDVDPAETGHWKSKEHAEAALMEGIARTAELQDKLYAQDNWALLLIFQAMDAAGKDGAVKHVMSGVNPQGCQVYSFKALWSGKTYGRSGLRISGALNGICRETGR